ncbi:coaE protein [alpha proteobacterium IMCC14465]|uniref:Dephospho-CoA kinase n=1 Tax=alpha proteobacterium IMCC14465 TaxID=1220535 RepID=J9A410_9PROT|nr:coaE protein [alpha proteobacterium IMCC14465]
MLLVGLTGSIGMGKSKSAELFAAEGLPVYDADASVHALYEKGGAAVAPLGKYFPDAIKNDAVDRTVLGQLVLNDSEKLQKLESIVHPLAGQMQKDFLETQEAAGKKAVILDIPLLLEKNAEGLVDVVVVVSTSPEIQKKRVLERPGMTEEKFLSILGKQMPDAQKREKADFIVDSSISIEDAHRQIRDIIRGLDAFPARALEVRKTLMK